MADKTLTPPIFDFSFKIKCLVIAIIGFALYINSTQNEFALDDGIVIDQNAFVKKGFHGIKDIMSHDAYYSYYKLMNANQMLAGGRYRPLSIVVFAVETSLFYKTAGPAALKNNPMALWHMMHFFSVFFYIICILTVFYFLHFFLFKKIAGGADMAFLAAVLFAIHPLHTEVVANVKSLDEILSLTFIMLTFIFALRYENADNKVKNNRDLVLGLLFFFFALLAKEYAITLIVLIPLLFHVLTKKPAEQTLIATAPYLGVFVLYMIMRIKSVGIPHNVPSDEILNNPYMLASHSQKVASEISVMGRYLFMLFKPFPLAADYSYNQLPYSNITDLSVIASVLIYGALIVWGFKLAIKRNMLAIPVFFYLANLAMVSNFLIDIGATMGERLAFHSSLGFVAVIAYYIVKLPIPQKKYVVTLCLAGLVTLCGYEIIPRNAQWKNDITLFTHDVTVVPNSIMVNGNAGARFLDMAEKTHNSDSQKILIATSIHYLDKAITMHPTYTTSYLNLGIAYWKLDKLDSAKMYWDHARRLYPDHPSLPEYYKLLGQSFLNKAVEEGKNGKYFDAIVDMKKGLQGDNNDPDLWYNLGGAYYTVKYWDSARYCWSAALQLKPDYAQAKQGLSALPPAEKTINGIR